MYFFLWWKAMNDWFLMNPYLWIPLKKKNLGSHFYLCHFYVMKCLQLSGLVVPSVLIWGSLLPLQFLQEAHSCEHGQGRGLTPALPFFHHGTLEAMWLLPLRTCLNLSVLRMRKTVWLKAAVACFCASAACSYFAKKADWGPQHPGVWKQWLSVTWLFLPWNRHSLCSNYLDNFLEVHFLKTCALSI